MSKEEFEHNFQERKKLIENMARNEVSDYGTISKIIQAYYFNPEEGLRMSEGDAS